MPQNPQNVSGNSELNGEMGSEVTLLLQAAARGDRAAAAELLPLVYNELRRLARSRMARLHSGQTLQPTALVHEAYLRVSGHLHPGWEGRAQFFAAAARAMRDILVDQARRRGAIKRGGGRQLKEADELDLAIEPPSEDVIALHEALERLESEDPRKGQIVNLRTFAGFSNEETAEALGVSVKTIEREWRFIRAWLQNEMGSHEKGDKTSSAERD